MMKHLKKILCLAIVLATLMTMVILPVQTSAADANIEVIGASIRTSGTQGFRFIGRIKKSAYTLTYGNSANFGILLIPKYMVNADTTITASTSNVLNIKAVKAVEYNHPELSSVGVTGVSGYIYFICTLTGIDASNYKTDFIARAYVNTTYSAQITRSVYQVAIDNSLTSIVNTANSYGTDMVVPVTSIN